MAEVERLSASESYVSCRRRLARFQRGQGWRGGRLGGHRGGALGGSQLPFGNPEECCTAALFCHGCALRCPSQEYKPASVVHQTARPPMDQRFPSILPDAAPSANDLTSAATNVVEGLNLKVTPADSS